MWFVKLAFERWSVSIILQIFEVIVLFIFIADISFTKFRHILFDIFTRFIFHRISDLQQAYVIAIFQFFQHDEKCELQIDRKKRNLVCVGIFSFKFGFFLVRESTHLSSQMPKIIASLNLSNGACFAEVRFEMAHYVSGDIWLEFLFDFFGRRTIHINAFVHFGCFLLFNQRLRWSKCIKKIEI